MRCPFGIHHAAVSYSMTTLGAGMMNHIFMFYYVKLFLNRYKISEVSFHQAQMLYMFWNAINDPLFGYIQDNSKLRWCSIRRLSILYGAPLYAIAFLLPWFPWKQYQDGDWLSGVHLIVALCAFDTMLTFVLLAQCALFAEISNKHENRLQLIKYNQVASLVGSCSVLFCGLVSNNMDNFPYFQCFNVLIAILAFACMSYTGIHSITRFEQTEGTAGTAAEEPDDALTWSSVFSLTKQIIMQRNFVLFVAMNFCQVFHLTFINNFMMIFVEHLLPTDVFSSFVKSIMYGAGFICPQILVLCSHSLLGKLGYYRVILYTFYMEMAAGSVMFLLGPNHYYLLALFFPANLVLAQAAFSLFNLPLADIIDSDLQTHKRRSPLSSMVFGTNALFTKPAQSLAPMLVVTILNQYGYEKLKDVTTEADPSSLLVLHNAMFWLVCLAPVCIAGLQILAWTPFSIRDSHTVQAKYTEN